MEGLIHIYEGDGKGKTSAATGLSVRCAGSGQKVLFSQFLKSGKSSELNILSQIDLIDIMTCEEKFGFVFRMSEDEKKIAAEAYTRFYRSVIEKAISGEYRLLVMDEILDAYNLGMVAKEEVIQFLATKPTTLEVVMTGRNPDEKLLDLADYVSKVQKIKHPFDKGIPARLGIEL